METQWKLLAFITLGALLCVGTALALPAPPTNITIGTSSSENLSSLPTVSVNAQAGNVTAINITALTITKSWQGYYGNISGSIVLADANNKTFYNWSMASITNGRIYATRNSSVIFTSVNCTNATQITNEIAALGQSASDADSVSNTFTATANPQFYVGSTNISANTCKTTNAFNSTGAQATQFFQVLLSDNASNIIYTTLVNGSQNGYNNQNWNFELLVGQNGHTGGPTVTPYYFYVELN